MGKCYNSIVVNAPRADVWKTICDFHDMSWAPGVITKLDVIGDLAGNQPGAQRILNDAFHETLLSIDADNFTFSYSIDDGPGPVAKDVVSNYVGKVRVSTATEDNVSVVEWESTYVADDDAAVGDFCNPIYQALLQVLKSHYAGT